MVKFMSWKIRVEVQSVRGASFCHVISKSPRCQGVLATTAGTHWWVGALPIFTKRPSVMSVPPMSCIRKGEDRSVRGPVRKIIEPVTWARKYFPVPSAGCIFLSAARSGRNASRLISIPIHAVSQFEPETLIVCMSFCLSQKLLK